LLVVEPVGRPVEMPGQSGDLREVDVDGLIGVAAQDQLLLHAFLEGCHNPKTLPLPNRPDSPDGVYPKRFSSTQRCHAEDAQRPEL